VCPGLHEFGSEEEGRYTVTWWDPNALQLGAEPPSGIRRPELITKDADPKVIADGLAVYKSWRAARDEAVEAGSRPTMRVQAATTWASRAEAITAGGVAQGFSPATALPDVEILPVDLPSDRPGGRRFGSLVHSVLSAVPLDAGKHTIRSVAEVHGRILGASADEISAAPGSVAAFLAHPVMTRARAARKAAPSSLRRELPVTLRVESGELVDGAIDLAFDEDRGLVLVDFKTDADHTGLARYRRQLQAYGEAIKKVTGKEVRLILLPASIPGAVGGPIRSEPRSVSTDDNVDEKDPQRSSRSPS
jgi:ATP-dependent exoDNAse (exonuclease V) beta subunit